MNSGHDPITRLLAAVAVALLSFILVWALVASASRPTIHEQLTQVEEQLTVVTCLLLTPAEDRLGRGIAECQLEPPG